MNNFTIKPHTGLQSLGLFLKAGNKLAIHQEVVFEKTLQNHIAGTIIDFKEEITEYNALTMCQICQNTATIQTELGVIHKVPFSMLYTAKEVKNA